MVGELRLGGGDGDALLVGGCWGVVQGEESDRDIVETSFSSLLASKTCLAEVDTYSATPA